MLTETTLHLKLPAELMAALKALAKSKHIGVSSVVRWLLSSGLEHELQRSGRAPKDEHAAGNN